MSDLETIFPKRDFFENLDHILDFQINDLKRSLELAGANFLVAMGCMNTIEFLGGIRNGKLGIRGFVESRFREGVSLLATENGVWLVNQERKPADADTMWILRNGLTHQYLPKPAREKSIVIFRDLKQQRPVEAKIFGEITRNVGEGQVTVSIAGPSIFVHVTGLLSAIEGARKKLVDELKTDTDKAHRAQEALSRLPELL